VRRLIPAVWLLRRVAGMQQCRLRGGCGEPADDTETSIRTAAHTPYHSFRTPTAVEPDKIDQRLTRLRMDNSAKPSRTGPARRSAIRSNFPQPVNRASSSPIQSVLLAAYSRLPQTDAGEG
jgi:hypothetical protein